MSDTVMVLIKKVQSAWKKSLLAQDGSISVLIISLFLILMTISIGFVDIADASYAKRELIQIIEPIVQSSARSISLPSYYQRTSDGVSSIQESTINGRVPIDCEKAISLIQKYTSVSSLRDSQIWIEKIECDGSEIFVQVSSEIRPVIDLALLNSSGAKSKGLIQIKAEVGAASIYHYS
jgi:hypothetical protein